MTGQENIPLKMIRETLENIPQFELPKQISLRWFQPGDEKIWREIQTAADKYNDITPSLFSDQFGSGAELLAQRQCYLLDAAGKPIGSSTAWFDGDFERGKVGRVHWLAVLPQHQCKGLGKALMTITCNRLRELGHGRTYLSTSSARLAAINLYLRFGFTPMIRGPEDKRVWQELQPFLKLELPL